MNTNAEVPSIDVLRELLPGDLSAIRGWKAEARARYLDESWQADGVSRADRRALLREIEGMDYAAIVAKYQRMPISVEASDYQVKACAAARDRVLFSAPAAKPAKPDTRREQYDEADYFSALEQLANFLKGITK
jgi:hypothetical protein